uniref:Uncharacterized protein n=1 Tax=Oryza sativa subsp. japonica TaxID=39947 RepID=Q67WH4_ORYSJ|nr:hypothetical protein [Oryza sativa Japonica Group]
MGHAEEDDGGNVGDNWLEEVGFEVRAAASDEALNGESGQWRTALATAAMSGSGWGKKDEEGGGRGSIWTPARRASPLLIPSSRLHPLLLFLRLLLGRGYGSRRPAFMSCAADHRLPLRHSPALVLASFSTTLTSP